MTIEKIVNRQITISKKFSVDSPAFSPAKPHCKSLGESKLKTFGKGPKNLFPSRFTILRLNPEPDPELQILKHKPLTLCR